MGVAPTWETVYERNSVERIKRDRPPLGIREELPALELRFMKLAPRRGEPLGHTVELLREAADLIPALVRDPDRR